MSAALCGAVCKWWYSISEVVRSAGVRIGDGCWLGAAAGVIVLPGVTIGPGCLISAGPVVTKDTEPNGIYVGIPARRVRTLPDGSPRAKKDVDESSVIS